MSDDMPDEIYLGCEFGHIDERDEDDGIPYIRKDIHDMVVEKNEKLWELLQKQHDSITAGYFSKEVGEANISLRTEKQELIEALEDCLANIKWRKEDGSTLTVVLDAIAKAKGESDD